MGCLPHLGTTFARPRHPPADRATDERTAGAPRPPGRTETWRRRSHHGTCGLSPRPAFLLSCAPGQIWGPSPLAGSGKEVFRIRQRNLGSPAAPSPLGRDFCLLSFISVPGAPFCSLSHGVSCSGGPPIPPVNGVRRLQCYLVTSIPSGANKAASKTSGQRVRW